MATDGLRKVFRWMNRFFMVPMFRAGFGPLIGNPFSGYIMVIKTTGRKTGRTRYTPVNFAILRGDVYCIAGWGKAADWYRNLAGQPELELLLPGGAWFGRAEELTDEADRVAAARLVLRNAGFAGYSYGVDPARASDSKLAEILSSSVVVRIRPQGPGSGPSDPGGGVWVSSAIIGWLALSTVLLWLWGR